MFDISVLKELKLAELQEIAKTAKTIKFTGVKKDTLISLILEHQASTSESAQEKTADDQKPKRARIAAEKKGAVQKNEAPILFEIEEKNENPEIATVPEKKNKVIAKNANQTKTEETVSDNNIKEAKVVKFSKSAYEKKMALQREKDALKEVAAVTVEETVSDSNLETVAEKTENAVSENKVNPNQLNKK